MYAFVVHLAKRFKFLAEREKQDKRQGVIRRHNF